MKETRFFYVPDAATATELPADEATHALRVLRLQAGDEMMLMDGRGNFYSAVVTLAHTKHCFYDIRATLPQQPQWKGHLHLAIAPTKMMERMEWMIEKAVEVGVDEITFLNCQFSERRVVKIPRVDKIAVSAMKQSRKAWKTQLNDMVNFREWLSQPHERRKYIAHCYEEVPRTSLFDELRKPADTDDALVLVGPEGDFSIDEVREAVRHGFVSVHLGESRLRTETAGLAAVMMMQLSKT
ncbi:MAG: 16S rRNA (uracil(1498)-N(3))-methyltransferase [Prevotella sp.]|nr:16S rRNA (uracil(1498)-N(3))-methyltransferase [Prevotella sp.]